MPGVREAVAARRPAVVGVSPIVGGAPVAGMADKLMPAVGIEVSALGLARHYRDLLGAWIIDEVDAATVPQVEALGLRCAAIDTIMTDDDRAEMRRARRAGAPRVTLEIIPVEGLPEISPGDDLAALVAASLAPTARDGDIVAVTQKVVSKAEGRIAAAADRAAVIDAETTRVLARRDDLVITATRHGFVCANAGVDASNVAAGTLTMLPDDPDASAARLRDALRETLGVDLGVVITDTFGRPWREGVVDVALGVAGMPAVVDLRGTRDRSGRAARCDRRRRGRSGRGRRRRRHGQGRRRAGGDRARADVDGRGPGRGPRARRGGRPVPGVAAAGPPRAADDPLVRAGRGAPGRGRRGRGGRLHGAGAPPHATVGVRRPRHRAVAPRAAGGDRRGLAGRPARATAPPRT